MFLYPAEPFAGRVPDEAYAQEQALAGRLQRPSALIDIEALLDGQAARALRWVPHSPDLHPALYRGWMLRPEVYETLYTALQQRNWQLLNTPAQYLQTHHLPESFAAIADHSPRTLWLPATSPDEVDWSAVRSALSSFGPAAVIVKDYVKSRKHEWHEACFIPDASDSAHATQVIQTFLTRQGHEFQGGLVLRAFEDFAALTEHSRSGMPLTREYRLFFLDGHIISAGEYWEEGEYPAAVVPLAQFGVIGAGVHSRFFTMDVAQRADGVWRVMELGDGQVAGLPERLDRQRLYAALSSVLPKPAHG
ncbi:ATP-grasp domain-containing protein [Deinococcus sp. KNUC1210]|uniref:ATP-grasp domain-containing protein n=1 Tax=Deinococcus sp. KNUC1210 TaxID=2917691 RepID=UPI001EF02D74|nr:ATP-grasp domain-containing protein [Deinococcus sp. KNUC1210]ULH16583.1 ATP-grasp domain-containing protein [Deinococcus sp. KNUC1210]